MTTGDIVNINPYTHLRFGVRNTKIESSRKRKGKKINEYATIVLVNISNKREEIHPLTTFIYDNWRNSSYNTQLARAKHLVTFLNHTLIEFYPLFKLKSVADLEMIHGLHFLEHKLEEGCSRKTITSYNSTLMLFYYYLANKKVLKNIKSEDFTKSYNHRNKQEYYNSLFIPQMATLPKDDVTETKAHTLEENHVIPFIKIAMLVADDIALGVYLSCFGGLRGSEVTSIKRSEIKKLGVFGEHGLIVKLKTDPKYAKGGGNRVKSPGVQPIEAVKTLLSELYKSHLARYPDPIDDSDSLFVNKRGTTMQYQTYNQRFNKVKEEFIERLKNSSDPDDKLYALNYQSLKWSTHIGRGTYSNNIAEECNNIIELMRARRDNSPESVLPYLVNTKKSINHMNQAIEEMYEYGGRKDGKRKKE